MTQMVDLAFNADTSSLDKADSALDKLRKSVPAAGDAVDKLGEVFQALASPVNTAIGLLVSAAGAAYLMSNKAIEAADNMNDFATNTGRSTVELSTFQSIAEKAGGDLTGMLDVLDKVAKGMSKGDDETIKFNKALDYFGVSAKDASGHMKTSQQVAQEVAEAYSKFGESSSKHAAAQEVLGRSYRNQIAPLLDLKKEEEERNFLLKTGAAVSADLAAASDDLNDTWHDFGSVTKGLGNQLAEIFIPMLKGVASGLIDSATNGGLLNAAFNILKGGAEIVVFALKGVIAFVATLDASFQMVGKTIAMVAAEMYMFANGDYAGMKNVWKEYNNDIGTTVSKLKERNAALFTGIQLEKDNSTKVKDPNGNFVSTNPKAAKAGRADKENDPNAGAEAYLVTLQRQLETVDQMTVLQRAGIEIGSKKLVNASAELKTQILLKAEEIDEGKRKDILLKYQKAINDQAQSYVDTINDAIKSQTTTTNEMKKQQAIRALDKKYEEQINELKKKGLSTTEAQTQAENDRAAAVARVEEAAKKEAANRGDWQGGIKAGWKDIEGQITDYNKLAQQYTVGTFDKMTSSLTDFVMTGKASFGDFAASILKDLAAMIIKMTLFQTIKAATSGTSIGKLFGFAQGGAFEGGVQAFASGTVVSSPSYFPMAGGKTGLMGEAGPEAIMPLTRTAGGELGVRMTGGGGGSNVIQISNHVTVQGGNTNKETADAVTNALTVKMQQIANNEITKALRTGGQMNPMKIAGFGG